MKEVKTRHNIMIKPSLTNMMTEEVESKKEKSMSSIIEIALEEHYEPKNRKGVVDYIRREK